MALRLDAQMATHLGERDLDGPAADEQLQDGNWIGSLVRAQERLRLELAGRIADQQPADWYLLARVIPECCARDDFESALALPIPARHRDALPFCFWIGQALE